MTGGNGAVLVTDELTGRLVYISANRVDRPSTASDNCPLCPGGRESAGGAGPYAFANRWPPLEDGRCEVIVYSRRHEPDLASLSADEVAAVVDLWADRSAAHWRQPGTECVLIFENRGEKAGATVEHPHGQLFSFPFLPPLCGASTAGECPVCRPPDPALLVEAVNGWTVAVPAAPPSPYCLRLSAPRHVDRLDRLESAERRALADVIGRSARRLDGLFCQPMPYQMWITEVGYAHLNVTVSALLRAPDRLRVLGAAEAATGLSFTPLSPQRSAAALRAAPTCVQVRFADTMPTH